MTSYVQTGRPSTVKTVMEYGTTDNEKKRHLLLKATEPMGVVQTYQYNTAGGATLTQTQDGTGSSFIRGTTGYTPDMNYAVSQTDARGRTVTSVTDAAKGTLTSVTDPNNQAVSYGYDTLRRAISTTAAADGKTYKNEYVYTADKLTQVKHNTTDNANCDVVYNFAYDALGNPTTVQVGATTLSTNVYTASGDKLLSRVNYENNGSVRYTRDGYKRITGIGYDNGPSDRYHYIYGANGQIAQVKDNSLSRVATYEYDLANRPMRIKQMEGTTHLYMSTLGYDNFNNLSSLKEKAGSVDYATTYTYDNGNRPTTVQFGDINNKMGYGYDALGWISTRTTTVGGTNYTTAYGFEAGGHGAGSTTALVNNITQNGQNFTYAYDNAGNITSVDIHRDHGIIQTYQTYTVLDEPGNQVYGDEALTQPVFAQIADFDSVEAKIIYHYDKLGQLVRVDDPYDGTAGDRATTWVYNYDRGGNITSKVMYACTNGIPGMALQTINYTYDTTWKDKLTAYNGVAISYDAIGNPLNDGTWTYNWQAGRQLASMSKSGTTINFAYNADGLRVRKTVVNGMVTDYTLNGKQVVHLKRGSDNLHFFYDAQSRPAIVDFNGVKYGYVHNLQGDVVAIIDRSGNQVVEYTYDAWGKPITKSGTLASTLGYVNPFRYRGYVFDEETGLYYLRSRYYNPVWGRFVNADFVLVYSGKLLAHSIFTYCYNNPIILSDTSGFVPCYNTLVADTMYMGYRSPGYVDWMLNHTRWEKEGQGLFKFTSKSNTTFFYSEGTSRVQSDQKVFPISPNLVPGTETATDYIGIFAKQSIINSSGTMGLTNGSEGIYLKGVNDVITTSSQIGINIKGGLGVTAKLKASAYTGRSTVMFEILGWTVEIGGTVDLGAIGGEASFGFINGAYNASANLSALVGLGFVIRVQPN